MPAKTVFDKDTVAQAAFRIVERDGQSALNARSLAKEAGCSTQPIYLRYPDMSAVRKEVIKLAREVYGGYISDGLRLKDSLFEGYLSAYIRFAREKPKLFGLLFMSDLGEDADDGLKDAIVGKISEVAGYDRVLEALQGADHAVIDDDVVAQHAHLRVARDLAVLDVAARDGADGRDLVGLAHDGMADDGLAVLRRDSINC